MNPTPLTFQDLLSTACSSVKPSSSNDFQQIYFLGDAKEAKLACDILVAHEFDAKLYRENGSNRLYIAKPTFAPSIVQKKLAACIGYARALKNIKQTLDTLNADTGITDYSITLAGNPASGGQIQIILHSPEPLYSTPSSSAPTVEIVSALPETAMPSVPPVTKKPVFKTPQPAAKLSSGPEIGRKPLFKPKKEKTDGWVKQMWLYVSGNSAVAGYIVLTVFIMLVILYSLFVVSKGYLCPDMVVAEKNKNLAWYCK